MTALIKALTGGLRRLLEGNTELPEQRMHLGFLFAAAIACFTGALFNYLGDISSLFFVFVLCCIGIGILLVWAYSRQRGYAQPAAVLICGVAVMGLLPLNWFNNQGMDGPSLMLFLVTAGYAFGILLTRPWQRLLFAVIFLLVPYWLITAAYLHPEWIAPYPSRAHQAVDAALTYSISIGLLLILVGGVFRRFRSEQRLIEDYAERLRESARRDSLTGLLNHSAFYSYVDTHCRGVANGPVQATLLLYDLDHFKITNDTHGHVYGDEALRFFAGALREAADAVDGVAGRCGGEEFAVLLPGLTRAEVETMDAALRDACRRRPLAHGVVKFSGGGSLEPASDVAQWMALADQALYAAKRRGRDHTVFDHRHTP